MSKELTLEDLRERVEGLMASVADLSDEIDGLRRELLVKEEGVQALEAELEEEMLGVRGSPSTLVQSVSRMWKTLPVIAGMLGALFFAGAVLLAFTQLTECGEAPGPMRLEGRGTAMVATPDHTPIGGRCDFFVQQVGAGECQFDLRCEGAEPRRYSERRRCMTDRQVTSSGEGGTTTTYYLRTSREEGSPFSFSEEQGLLEIEDGDSQLVVVFHELDGQNRLNSEGPWSAAGDD